MILSISRAGWVGKCMVRRTVLANVGYECTGFEVPTVVMFVFPVARSTPFLLQDWGDYWPDDLNFGWQCRQYWALSGRRSENIDFDQHLIFLLCLPRFPIHMVQKEVHFKPYIALLIIYYPPAEMPSSTTATRPGLRRSRLGSGRNLYCF